MHAMPPGWGQSMFGHFLPYPEGSGMMPVCIGRAARPTGRTGHHAHNMRKPLLTLLAAVHSRRSTSIHSTHHAPLGDSHALQVTLPPSPTHAHSSSNDSTCKGMPLLSPCTRTQPHQVILHTVTTRVVQHPQTQLNPTCISAGPKVGAPHCLQCTPGHCVLSTQVRGRVLPGATF